MNSNTITKRICDKYCIPFSWKWPTKKDICKYIESNNYYYKYNQLYLFDTYILENILSTMNEDDTKCKDYS